LFVARQLAELPAKVSARHFCHLEKISEMSKMAFGPGRGFQAS
jgi:hypothetical protein